jgi:signal transduction histidine kinase
VALAEPRDPEQYRDVISSILEETQRLNLTIDSLLLLARAETGNSPAASENIALAPLVMEVTNMLSVLAEEKDIQLLVQDGGGNTEIYGDRNLLRVAFINVLHNALKFSPQGGIVRVNIAQDEALASVTIADQGPGIEKDEFDAVFERFFRGRGVSANYGNGLGLSIVKLIVNRAGGSIQFDRSVDIGALVLLQLPLASSIERHVL